MLRVRLSSITVLTALSSVLAGCSGMSLSMPDWLSSKPPAPPEVALQLISQPPGADASTPQGQACKTPCVLTLPLTPQSITFTMPGFLPQTIQVEVTQTSPPEFAPNPVEASLVAPPPPKKPVRHKPKVVKKPPPPAPRPAATTGFPPPPPPQQQPAASSPFPPPSPSPFPPPQQQQQ